MSWCRRFGLLVLVAFALVCVGCPKGMRTGASTGLSSGVSGLISAIFNEFEDQAVEG